MTSTSNQPWIVRFGAFDANLKTGELRKQGTRIKLQEQPFQVLAMLLEKPGEIVTREEIQKRLWPENTFVDFDHSLNKAINKVRDALCDSADNPRFVETLARRSYRFIAPVDGNHAHTTATAEEKTPAEPVTAVPAIPAPGPSWWKRHNKVLSGVVILGSLSLAYLFRPALPPPRLGPPVQLSQDKHWGKFRLYCDGSNLYFNEVISGKDTIVQLSVFGGETVKIPVPLPSEKCQAELLDYSRTRQEFLIRIRPPGLQNNISKPTSLFAMSLPTVTLRRIGDLEVTLAIWSPDGQQLFYTKEKEAYLSNADGTQSRQLASFESNILDRLCWSPDGRKVRFLELSGLPDSASLWRSIWEINLTNLAMHQTLQGWSKKRWDRPSCWSPGGDYFLFLAGPGGSRNGWALSEKKSIWQKIKPEPVQLTYGPMEFYDFRFSPDGKKLYGVGEITQGELCKLDIQTGQLKLFLEGISAMYVDFSRENDRITYVSYPDRHLWRSRADGSQKLQLVNSMHVRQPRWSPDGKQIVFQSPQVGKDMLYLIGSEGGTPRPLLPGGLRGDAPNWSPDGTGIVFGTYPNDVKQSPMKISILDMKTGRISDVKGSDGFANPQWSPDGKCLVAAVLNSLELMMFDFKTDEWSLLDKGPAVYHKWSRDGKYIYAYRLTAPIALYRIDVTKRRAETIVDLSNANYVEFWMGLSSNDEPLLLRDLSTQEIYAFDWIAP